MPVTKIGSFTRFSNTHEKVTTHLPALMQTAIRYKPGLQPKKRVKLPILVTPRRFQTATRVSLNKTSWLALSHSEYDFNQIASSLEKNESTSPKCGVTNPQTLSRNRFFGLAGKN